MSTSTMQSVPTSSAPRVMERPRRPLSAYNLFFKDQRAKLLKNRPVRPEGVPLRRGHGKMGFAEMAKTIAKLWNEIDPANKSGFEALARQEKLKYKQALNEWRKLSSAAAAQQKQTKNVDNTCNHNTAAPTPVPSVSTSSSWPILISSSRVSPSCVSEGEDCPAPILSSHLPRQQASWNQHYFQPHTQVFRDSIQTLADQFDQESLDFFVNLFHS